MHLTTRTVNRTLSSITAAALLLLPACTARSSSETPPILIEAVAVVDVDAGLVRSAQTVLVAGDRIAGIWPAASAPRSVPRHAVHVDGGGRYLIPGLWDMHVHAHRSGRAAWHYPLYRAHGIVGVRDAGTWADSAARWRSAAPAPGAPRVWWGSPPIDGVPMVLEFGVEVRSPLEARAVARRFHAQGFQFLKVYDRLDSASHDALLHEARVLGIPVEGHVPLRTSPRAAVLAGQRAIDHLTLVLESCIPGTLSWVAADSGSDSMTLLSDGRLAATLDRYDAERCRALFAQLVERQVWQIPTLVQLRAAFVSPGSDSAELARRLADIPAAMRADWEAYDRETPPAVRTAGAAVFRREVALVGELHRAGVPLLAGTDASDEPWVFPGASLHDELALFVEAGLSPLEALRTATRNPARYRGDTLPLIAVDRPADLVLLSANPLENIEHVRRIEQVIVRGQLFTPARR